MHARAVGQDRTGQGQVVVVWYPQKKSNCDTKKRLINFLIPSIGEKKDNNRGSTGKIESFEIDAALTEKQGARVS